VRRQKGEPFRLVQLRTDLREQLVNRDAGFEHARPVVSSISCFTHAPISRATRQISDVDLDVADAAIFDLRDEGGDLRLQ
jgi:hypothetical protein